MISNSSRSSRVIYRYAQTPPSFLDGKANSAHDMREVCLLSASSSAYVFREILGATLLHFRIAPSQWQYVGSTCEMAHPKQMPSSNLIQRLFRFSGNVSNPDRRHGKSQTV